jgi:hypothetical protein
MNTKQAIIIGSSITIIGVLGLILFNRMKKKKDSEVVENTNESSSSVSTEADNYNTFNDRKILKDAMAYWLGTNEKAIDNLISRTTQKQRDKIRMDWDSNLSLYGGDTLKKWIEGDFSGKEKIRILKAFGY